MSTIIIILIAMIAVSILIIVLLAKSNKSMKREIWIIISSYYFRIDFSGTVVLLNRKT